jgi:hypothetical protein
MIAVILAGKNTTNHTQPQQLEMIIDGNRIVEAKN